MTQRQTLQYYMSAAFVSFVWPGMQFLFNVKHCLNGIFGASTEREREKKKNHILLVCFNSMKMLTKMCCQTIVDMFLETIRGARKSIAIFLFNKNTTRTSKKNQIQ